MELMIKNSQILTIMIQAFMITVIGIILVGCWNELIYNIRKGRKLMKKGGRKRMGPVNEYLCPVCGYSAWALEHISECTCPKCGSVVKTKPVHNCINEKSFVVNERDLKMGQQRVKNGA